MVINIDKHPIVTLLCVDGHKRLFYIVRGQDAILYINDSYIMETDKHQEWYLCLFDSMLVCKSDKEKLAGELLVSEDSDTDKLDLLFNKLCLKYKEYVLNSLEYVYNTPYDIMYTYKEQDRTNQRLVTGLESEYPSKIKFSNGEIVDIDCLFYTNYLNNILLSEDIRFLSNIHLAYVLKRFYLDNIPKNILRDELTIAMLDFLSPLFGLYTQGMISDIEDAKQLDLSYVIDDKGPIEKVVLFAEDGQYIYCAFLEQYNIDLLTPESHKMHWWRFQTLLSGLHETKFNDIVLFRLLDKPTPQEKKIQRKVKLPVYPKHNVYEKEIG